VSRSTGLCGTAHSLVFIEQHELGRLAARSGFLDVTSGLARGHQQFVHQPQTCETAWGHLIQYAAPTAFWPTRSLFLQRLSRRSDPPNLYWPPRLATDRSRWPLRHGPAAHNPSFPLVFLRLLETQPRAKPLAHSRSNLADAEYAMDLELLAGDDSPLSGAVTGANAWGNSWQPRCGPINLEEVHPALLPGEPLNSASNSGHICSQGNVTFSL